MGLKPLNAITPRSPRVLILLNVVSDHFKEHLTPLKKLDTILFQRQTVYSSAILCTTYPNSKILKPLPITMASLAFPVNEPNVHCVCSKLTTMIASRSRHDEYAVLIHFHGRNGHCLYLLFLGTAIIYGI